MKIIEKNVLKAYKETNSNGRKMLENLFGKELFSMSITDKVKTFDDAIKETGRPQVPDFLDVPEDMREHFKATYKVMVIVEALNEDEKMDVYNINKHRHYPYFRHNCSPSTFGFDGSEFGNVCAFAGSGLRLCFKSDELATYAGKQFKNEFQDLLTK